MKRYIPIVMLLGAGSLSAASSIVFFSTNDSKYTQTGSGTALIGYGSEDFLQSDSDAADHGDIGEDDTWEGGAFITSEALDSDGAYYNVKAGGNAAVAVPWNDDWEQFGKKASYATEAELLAARPMGATYTHDIDFVDGPSATVSSTSPSNFDDVMAAAPTFAISGASGVWSTNMDGDGVLTIDPSTVAGDFTITMSVVAPTTKLSHYSYGVSVSGAAEGFHSNIEDHDGEPLEWAGAAALADVVLTFSAGEYPDGDDEDASTYGFKHGDSLFIEGFLANAQVEEQTGALPIDEVYTAIAYQANTGFQIDFVDPTAVPEPSSVSLLGLGSLALLLRRKRA